MPAPTAWPRREFPRQCAWTPEAWEGGHTARLDEEELRAALRRLPDWTGDSRALTRTLVLPPDRLERVLLQVDGLTPEPGRGPRISRPDERTAQLVVRTGNVGGVTALDVDLAVRVDETIADADAGQS